jgi:undecaprenyl-diphosphatase
MTALVLTFLATLLTNGLMLYLAADAVGLQLTMGSAVVAMSTGVALGSLIPTPGGIGGVEAGLIASLYALGFDLHHATAAALLYRFATYALPFIPGIGAYLWLRKSKML